MRRYRVLSPVFSGHWRATKELARQDAIIAGLGYRDPATGLATIDPDVRFDVAEGEAKSSQADLLEGDALAVLVVHGRDAEAFVRRQMNIQFDPNEFERWQAILTTIEALRYESRRHAAVRDLVIPQARGS